MKFAALALDYDGTIATDGVLDGDVREAIGEARQHGIVVVLVTGRRLADLRHVAGDLTCFDVVVAENGAVLEFPLSGRHALIGHPPHPDLVRELHRRRVDISVGESVIEADATSAPVILDVIRTMEQPLILAFNRGRVMLLPQAVAKSTGLRQALLALRVSIHNTIAIGDAENDHDLLDACEVGVAVGWGSPALRAMADEVIDGTGPDAVAAYIRRVSLQPRLAAAQMGRRRLLLGHQHNGEPVSLAVRGRTILIAGEPGTGKSWLAGLLCEQLILQGYCLCIIDPEGDYRALEALPGVITLGGDDPPPQARELLRALRHPDVSVIVDLSKIPHHEKRDYLHTLLPLLATLRRRTGLPHKILLDEAHYFLAGRECRDCIDTELASYMLVTYRISGLEPSLRAASDTIVLVTRETDPLEIETLKGMCPALATDTALSVLRDLAANEAALLPGPDEAGGRIRRFQLAPRLTAHVRHQSKYLDMPVIDSQAFVFGEGGRPGPRAQTLKAFTGILATLPGDQIACYLRRHDFSHWMDGVFRDRPLAAHLRHIEARVDTDDAREIADEIAQAIRARYETAAERDESRTIKEQIHV
jgi:hydroxymethylpyrimidine pyrophosphatase-like HAD family hydrolase